MSEQPKYRIHTFWSHEKGGYIADVPDLKNCSAFGETYEDALREVLVTMDGRLDVAQQTDRPIPEPRTRRVIGSFTSTVGKGEPLRKATLKRVVELFSWLLVLLPVVVGFLYVRVFGVNVVYIDAWSMPPLFDKWASGTLSLWDLYYQHNEHRMFFPKGVELLLGVATKYNNLAEMYLIEACFLVTLGLLLLAFRTNTKPWPLLFVPISLLIFSLRGYENMLLGFQINFAFTQLFGVLALFLLYSLGRGSGERLAFGGALASSTVATFSTAQGLFVWPAGLMQLLIGSVGRSSRKVLVVVWSLAGLAEWVAYFSAGYQRLSHAPSWFYALEHPVEGAQFFLTLLGNSLFWRQSSTLLSGLLVACFALVSVVLLAKARKRGEYSFWVSLLVYSLLGLTAITMSRAENGVGYAMVSRYVAFSVLVVIGVYAMVAKTVFERRSATNTALLVVLSGVILLSAAVSYPEGIVAGRATEAQRERAALLLSTGRYESRPDAVIKEAFRVPSAEMVRRGAPILRTLDYNVYSDSTYTLAELPSPEPVSADAGLQNVDVLDNGDLYAHPPSGATFTIKNKGRPVSVTFTPSFLSDVPAEKTDGVTFMIFSGKEGVYQSYVHPDDSVSQVALNLPKASTEDELRLSFVTRVGPAGDRNYDWAVWRDVRIVIGGGNGGGE